MSGIHATPSLLLRSVQLQKTKRRKGVHRKRKGCSKEKKGIHTLAKACMNAFLFFAYIETSISEWPFTSAHK